MPAHFTPFESSEALVEAIDEAERAGETVVQVVKGATGGWVIITRPPSAPYETRGDPYA